MVGGMPNQVNELCGLCVMHVDLHTPSSSQLKIASWRKAKDVDEVVPFAIQKVIAAPKPAMESEGCNVAEETSNRIECKRARRFSGAAPSSGGESVTAILEATGDQTHVHISTGKGFYGRSGKTNWSTPIYQGMMNGLQAQLKPKEGTSQVAASSEVASGTLQDKTPIAFSNWG